MSLILALSFRSESTHWRDLGAIPSRKVSSGARRIEYRLFSFYSLERSVEVLPIFWSTHSGTHCFTRFLEARYRNTGRLYRCLFLPFASRSALPLNVQRSRHILGQSLWKNKYHTQFQLALNVWIQLCDSRSSTPASNCLRPGYVRWKHKK